MAELTLSGMQVKSRNGIWKQQMEMPLYKYPYIFIP